MNFSILLLISWPVFILISYGMIVLILKKTKQLKKTEDKI